MNPLGYMQQVSNRLDSLATREQIEPVLDELEYIFEVLDPEMQDSANQLIETLRARLDRIK